MRVIAGKFRSRIFKSLKGQALRPTSDRLRETLFDVLGGDVSGARFLDLFAGTGAVGIEALSRGAAHAVFVERHPPAVRIIRENLASLGVASEAGVLSGDAMKILEKMDQASSSASGDFNLVFVDPPYAARDQYRDVLHFLGSSRLLDQAAIVVTESYHKMELPKTAGKLERYRVLRQGDAALTFYRKIASAPANLES
ncbi:MAG TPA: 16S rRNA (guanine(966)-N(2))-methyltransferase RsmD [Terriglobales bacterium]|nr:16S rRNA (guanine(966)-N(2))-methyltransferase RsmD [Terriglobales bacterium]